TKQYLSFAGGTPLQHGVAAALGAGSELTDHVGALHRARRDRLVDGLLALGIPTTRSAGTYFVTADLAVLGHDDGDAFCRWAPGAIGVAAVPVSAFVRDPEPVRSLVRFAFCKDAGVLDAGLERLGTLVSGS
ncbi:MAG: aminotransferase, partial [Actinomycetota bacterium]